MVCGLSRAATGPRILSVPSTGNSGSLPGEGCQWSSPRPPAPAGCRRRS
jgi:hypothetical protein